MDALEAALTAYDIRRYICIDDFQPSDDDFFRKMESELMEQSTPESLFFEKEYCMVEEALFDHLSEEAKQVVALILDCPDEMMGIIGLRKNGLSLKKLTRYLRRQWEEKRVVVKVMQEIGLYAARLEAYSQGISIKA